MDTDFDLNISSAAQRLNADEKMSGDFTMTKLLPTQIRHTEFLAHLASYSELLVVVTGPEGAGKTVIANALAAQRTAPEDTLFLTASIMLGMPSIMSAIANHWDMPSILEDSGQAREMIRSEALARLDNGAGLLVIIDQAEQLDPDTLNDIASFGLLAPQAISFVLFGLSGYEASFRHSPAQAPIHILEIEPLEADEVTSLVAFTYGDQGICPLDASEIDRVLEESGGWPGSLLPAAELMLLKPRTKKGTSTGFPMRNIIGIAAIATLLIMGFIFQVGKNGEGEQSHVAIDSTPGLPQEVKNNAPETAAATDYNYPAEVAKSPTPQVATKELAVVPLATVTELPPEGEKPDLIATNTTNASPKTEVAPKPAVIAKPVEPVVDTSPSAKVEKTVKVTQPTYTADEAALLAASEGYIVQLLGSYSSEGASGFISTWQSKVTGTLYKYQTRHNDRDWFVVVSGIYPNKAEAKAAVNALPSQLRGQSPWIRSLNDAQSAIR